MSTELLNKRSAAKVEIRPVPMVEAMRRVNEWHRRLPVVVGGLWGLQAIIGGECVGVCIIGRPVARMTCAAFPADLELTRMAVRDGAPNACSALYAAAARAARVMGASDLFTKTHSDETGHSLRCASWIHIRQCGGGEWGRASRPRPAAADPLPKQEWAVAWGRRAQLANKGHQ